MVKPWKESRVSRPWDAFRNKQTLAFQPCSTFVNDLLARLRTIYPDAPLLSGRSLGLGSKGRRVLLVAFFKIALISEHFSQLKVSWSAF